MIEIPLGEMTWYGVSRIFPTPGEAKAAYGSVHEYDPGGGLDIGLYRHQRIGLDRGPVLVTAVGLRKEGVETAARLLGGEEIELHRETWLVMIKRRAEVVLALGAQGKESGRYSIEHAEGGDLLR